MFKSTECVKLNIDPFFWNFTRRRMVVLYRRFGLTYRSHL